MRLFRFGLWIVFLFLVTGCSLYGFSFEQEQPPDRGAIMVYTTLQQEQIDAYLALFNAEYPNIRVNVFRESTGIITERLLAEAADPQADLIWAVPIPTVMLAEWKFMLHGYAPAGLERIEDSRFRDHANPPHWVGLTGWKSVFCVNYEKLNELQVETPKSGTDLAKPIYSGQIVIPNPTTSGTALLLIAAVFEYQSEVAGWQYLDQLHQNVALYTHSGAEPCRLVADGQYAIGISNDVTAAALKSEGKPIHIIFPAEGIGWGMDVNALMNKKNIQPAAKTFLDWAISDAAMNKYAEKFAMTSVKTNRPLPAGYPADTKMELIDVSFPWITANSQRILHEWRKRYGSTLAP